MPTTLDISPTTITLPVPTVLRITPDLATLVTPDMAQEWLTRNVNNRNMRQRKVEQYKRDILSGDYDLNGETIKFDRDGRLIDGQHRLTAVVETGIAVRSFVIWDLEPAAKATVDTGATRNAADVFAWKGHKQTTALQGAVRLYETWRTGDWSGGKTLSVSELEAVLEQNQDIVAGVRDANAISKTWKVPHSVAAVALTLFRRANVAEANLLYEDVVVGANLAETDPAFVLRGLLHRRMTVDARIKKDSQELLALFVKTWNNRRTGTTKQFLRYSTKQEGFPFVHGLPDSLVA